MANIAINSLNYNNDNYIFTIPYGVCDTAADTAAKIVEVENFSLEEGAVIIVKFKNANSASSPTLNVNETGAKAIMRYGTTAASTSSSTSGWAAGAVQLLVYDGTNWVREYWNNSTYSNISLGQGYATCTTAAATVAKTVALSSYALSTGGIVSIKFSYDVPANATLNINSKGAKAIYHNGAAITAGIIKAGNTATFIYDGTRYQLIAIDVIYKADAGIKLDGTTFKHTNSITAKTSGTQTTASPGYGGTFTIMEPLYDAQGHITGTSSATITMPVAQNIPTALKNPNSLTIGNIVYDGSEKKTVTAADLGITGAMLFKGTSSTEITDGGTQAPTIGGTTVATSNLQAGNVVLYGNQEFVWNSSSWELLGDEGSYALKGHTHNYAGSSSAGGAANSANKLTTARTIQTNLASTAAASFDGSANIMPGVTGILGTANGGTGSNTHVANRLTWSTSANQIRANSHYASADKVGINSTSEPSTNFYVNGTSAFNGDVSLDVGSADRYLTFNCVNADGYNWRIGYLGSGSGDANYLVFQNNKDDGASYQNALRFGLTSLDAAFGGNVYPLTNNEKTLGTSSLKWSNVYATTFTGSLSGNASSANQVNNNLTIKLNGGTTEGTDLFTFNGSVTKSVNITPTAIGASPDGHTHDQYLPLTAGENKKLTGPLGLTKDIMYGPVTPNTGNEFQGQLFFLEDDSCPLPKGGTANQFLVKKSNTDGEAEWKTLTININGDIEGTGTFTGNTLDISTYIDGSKHEHNYLPLTGGVVSGNITANNFIGDLQGQADYAAEANYAETALEAESTKKLASDDKELNSVDHFYEANVLKWGSTHSSFEHGTGNIISMGDNLGYGSQIWFDNSTITDNDIFFRGKYMQSSDTWGSWKKILHTFNYQEYTVTKTGYGATGTWNISISGNASTASKVNNNLTIKLNGGTTEGTNLFTFNGSTAKTINITPAAIGAAGASHGTHVSYGTTASAISTTASAGTATTVSRSDHVHSLDKATVVAALGYTPPTTNTTYESMSSSEGITGTATTDRVLTAANLKAIIAGSAASSAAKLTVNAGSSTKPVYFQNGIPTECGDTLNTNISGNANTATKLQTAQTIQTNLASTTAASFDGTANVTPGITGVLGTANGGTGLSALVTPTVTLTAGTTTGPTLAIKDSLGKTSTAVAIPSASDSASGVVTTGSQTFAGAKTFNSSIRSNSTTYGLGVSIWTDAEGGNIQIYPPDSTSVDFWENNAYNGDLRWYCKLSDGTVKTGPHIKSSNMGIYGAVWNDYAEFRICNEDFKPGQVVLENGDDTLSIASQRLQRGCSIISDTFGFAIGETDEAKCPIAVSGRVLAYGYESREEFKKHVGWPVCSGPNGTVSIMTEEEEEKYPSRIIGTISAVPDYETWGTGNVLVNNRIWIKIK